MNRRYDRLHIDAAIGLVLLVLIWIMGQVLVGDNSGEPAIPAIPTHTYP